MSVVPRTWWRVTRTTRPPKPSSTSWSATSGRRSALHRARRQPGDVIFDEERVDQHDRE
jgi:hypothetical protein